METQEIDIGLDFKLSPKQEQIYEWCKIGNGIQYVVVCTGRQVGKTLTDSVVSVDWSLGNEGFRTGFFLPTYKQCKKVFNGVKRMLTPLHDHLSFNQSDYTITFWNGSVIQFFTADNDNCRGFTFDGIICDEACFIKDEIWSEAIEPTVAVSLSKKNEDGQVGFSGKVLLTSTPKAKNWFYGMVKQEDGRTRVTRFTSEEGGIIAASILERIKKRIPESAYKNEYLGEFLDAGNGLFNYVPCLMSINTYARKAKNGLIAGLDIAAKHDYTVLTILNRYGELIYIGRWRYLDYSDIMNNVHQKLIEYGSPMCYVETNGVGQAPYEMLRDSYGRAKEWNTSSKTKTDIIINLQLKFSGKKITIPKIQYLMDELDYFTCEWKNGKATYQGSNGFHDDCVMSLAIAVYHLPLAVQSIDIHDFSNAQNSNLQDNYQ